MSKYTISWHEWLFVSLIGLFGILFYMKSWLVFLNNQNPIVGFLIYYGIWFVILFVLSLTGFVILGTKIKNPVQIIGTLLIVFAINVILNWTNGYVTYAVTGSFNSSSQIFYGSEDGALWYLVYNVLHITSIPLAKFISFSIMPMFLAIIGAFLVRKVKFDMFS